MELPAAIEGALAALDGLVDAAPLREASAWASRPWTVAIVGRTGAGKSSLVNALSGTDAHPTGLGGITTDVATTRSGAAVLLDTPGIDDPDEALPVLERVFAAADAVVWVVDGLQPLTASERAVIEHTLPEGTPLHVVVSRADLLEPSDVGSVLDRVRDLTSRLSPSSLRLAALRSGAGELHGLVAIDLPGPRRAPRLRAAVGDVRAALANLPPVHDARALAGRWRTAVRETVLAIEADIDAGHITHKTDAVAALVRKAEEVRKIAPHMPAPEGRPDDPLVRVLDGFSGIEGARRVLRAAAARWLVEGEVALLDSTDAEAEAEFARRARAVAALDHVDAALRGPS